MQDFEGGASEGRAGVASKALQGGGKKVFVHEALASAGCSSCEDVRPSLDFSFSFHFLWCR